MSFDIAKNALIPEDPELFSIGLHPWSIDEGTLSEDMRKVAKFAGEKRCAAIGECGLDRLKGPSLEVQTEVFRQHIEIANFAEKALVIHCVRAFPELLAIKNEFKKPFPWIVHGFSGSPEIAEQLLKHGIYISFGVEILYPEKVCHRQAELRKNTRGRKLQQILVSIPNNRFFLETDEIDIPVSELYREVSLLKKIPVGLLKKQLFCNALSCKLPVGI